MAKIAIVYYSLAGQTIAPGMKIVNLEKATPPLRRSSSRRQWAATYLNWRPLRPMWRTT